MALTKIQPFGIDSSGTFTFEDVVSTGNVTGAYILGNGSQLTGLPEQYGNANVAAYLPTYTGNLVSLQGNVTTTGNISANYFIGNFNGQANTAGTAGTVTDAAQPNITSVGTLTSVSVTGNVIAGNITGNGSGLTSITGANVTGTVANATSAGSATTAGTVTTAAQPNITSVGTLSSVSVSGNVTGGNLTTAGLTSTGTLQTSGNAIVGGNLIVNGNTVYINITELNVQDPIIGLGRGANNTPLTVNDGKDRGTEMWYYDTAERAAFVGFDNSTGKLIAAANVSIANEIVTVNSYGTFVAGAVESATVSATGNITGNFFIGNGSQLTGLPESYSNANVAAYLPTYTGNLASLAGNVTTTANVTGNFFIGNGSQLTGIEAGAVTTFSATAPVSPAQGDVWIESDTGIQYIYFNDGTSSQWAEMEAQTSVSSGPILSAVAENILPAADVTYDLGSATHRWRDIYLSGNTINLGGATIKTDAGSGAIALIPEPTEANPNPSGMVVSPSGGITVVSTVGGEVSGNAIANAAASPTAAPVPIDITTTAPQNGQALIWNTANAEFVPGNVAAGGATVSVYGNISGLPLSNVSTGSMAFVSSNNRLYLWNGTGWFNIALINTSPTITGGANPTYVFATDGTPIVLTLVASDPEGIPLTWSYEVTSGVLGNTATVTNVDNVFTITPSTNDADGGTFQLTFSASDGVNIGTAASSFTLLFGAADPYYKQSVLLSTTGTNNGTNNTFVDSSTNNFTVTRNGNATQGAFGPFSPAGWSGSFDGTGDYLSSVVNTSLDVLANTNFTVEGWCYLDARVATRPAIFSNYNSFTTGGLSFWAGHGASIITQFQVGLSGTFPALNAGTIPYNSWFHWAIVRNGTGSNNITVYINGTSIGTISSNVAITTTGNNLWLGASGDAVANAGIDGYMSNFRWVTGTAIYTANFAPPTEPLTAVSGTSLLTLQSNRFVDNSVNNFAITRNGDARIAPFSPFDPLTAYDTSINGGSAYFDGTGDFLSTAGGAGLSLDADFTISFWMNMNALGAAGVISNNETSFFGQASVFLTNHSSAVNKISFWTYNIASGGFLVASTTTLTVGQWFHVALSRQSGTLRLFVNGKLEATRSSSTGTVNLIANGVMNVGKYWGGSLNGYVSNIRIVKGTALYTTDFTVPTAPVTAVANTSLLLNFTNANIFDETGKVVMETLGNAKVSTSVVKYGTGSIFFDGTGDYLTIPQDQLFNFSGDFTIEYWVRFASASTVQTVVSNYANNTTGWGFQRRSDTNVLAFFYGDTVLISRSFTPTLNQWYYLTIARQGTNLRMWVDGVQQGVTVTNSTNLSSPSPTYVGLLNPSIGQLFNGYISDLRITNGVARYTANFTPPTAQLGFDNPE